MLQFKDQIVYLVIHTYASNNYGYTDLLCFYNFFLNPKTYDIKVSGKAHLVGTVNIIVCISHQIGSTSWVGQHTSNYGVICTLQGWYANFNDIHGRIKPIDI